LGVTVTFLTISALLAIGVVLFLSGLILHRGVCLPLENPTNDEIFNHIDKFIDLNKLIYANGQRNRARNTDMQPLKISEVIESCGQNQSIYKVLKLRNYFDINEILSYPQRFDIDSQLEELINNAEIQSNVEILSPEAEEAIRKLAQSELKDFSAYKFTDNLNPVITKHNLEDIAHKLTETADNIAPNADFGDVRTSLKNQALHLSVYQQSLVSPMTRQTKELIDLATTLEHNLKFNRDSFEEALQEFILEIRAAQQFINKEGTEFVRKVAKELVLNFKIDINNYLNLVVNQTENDLGKCGPLANVYESVRVAGCNRIINPLNGFWAGIIGCVLIFLPMIIFSLKLSTLYQKSDPYPGPLVESEYLYDAYSERDNIPLANGPKNKRRKKNDRRHTSRDRRADYYEDSSSPRLEAPREARYNDMAPKHWDGGPPRYQNPPVAPPASEYERPPPYYFPGASSDHD
jgi:prominin 1